MAKSIKSAHVFAETENDCQQAVVFVDNAHKFTGFALAFQIEPKGDFYYQGFHLDMRHNAKPLFNAARTLYGRLKRAGKLPAYITFQRLLKGY